ncbi:MAG: MFS transporter [Candidatus Hydrogenedentes bacterium]|nr:MFS transporter [Candidatus Hydrogenedentota bacterium]
MAQGYDKSNYRSGFWALIATQAQGAFSDNLFRWIIVYLLLGTTATATIESSGKITALAGMLFALPFFLFVGIFGAISDRYSKQRVIVALKHTEILIMVAGGLALLTQNAAFLWVTLFLMATQSAQFSPCKYAILPEALPEERLSWGNGFIQATTMLAIIAGTGLAGPLFSYLNPADRVHWVSAGLVVLAIGGVIMARRIFQPPAANPNQSVPINPYAGTMEYFKIFWRDSWLGLSVLAYTYFWFLAALIQINLVPFGYVTMGLTQTQISYMMVAVFMGIGIGSVAAGYLSRGKVEPGLVPIGALGMSVFGLLLGFPWYGLTGCIFLLFGLGFSAGFFDVPVASMIQRRSPAHLRGRAIITANMLTWIGIFLASALYWVLSSFEVSPYTIFLASAVISFGVGLYICIAQPVFLLRSVLWLLTNTFYRVRVVGREHIPESGGALLVANHTSFLDALIILASMDRQVRFIMYKGIYEVPWIRPLAKMMGAIPIAPGGGPREVVQSLRSATDAIKAGELVCIFAEGQITRTGQMLPFRR